MASITREGLRYTTFLPFSEVYQPCGGRAVGYFIQPFGPSRSTHVLPSSQTVGLASLPLSLRHLYCRGLQCTLSASLALLHPTAGLDAPWPMPGLALIDWRPAAPLAGVTHRAGWPAWGRSWEPAVNQSPRLVLAPVRPKAGGSHTAALSAQFYSCVNNSLAQRRARWTMSKLTFQLALASASSRIAMTFVTVATVGVRGGEAASLGMLCRRPRARGSPSRAVMRSSSSEISW